MRSVHVLSASIGESAWQPFFGGEMKSNYPGNAIKGTKGFVVVPVEKRIWSRIEKTETCWLWKGSTDGRYGQVRYRGRHYRVHRLIWEIRHGEIPDGAEVCHHCDTTLCVNPDHLFLGSHKDNMTDMAVKGRAARGNWLARMVVCKYGHPYTPENTRYVRGTGHRVCIACRKIDNGKKSGHPDNRKPVDRSKLYSDILVADAALAAAPEGVTK